MGAGRGQVVIWTAAVVLAGLAVVRLLDRDGGGERVPVPAVSAEARGVTKAAPSEVSGPMPSGTPEAARLYVHVAGRVRRPGLYRLEKGARVADAVDRAGGASRGANLAAVNLAAPLQDGQQVLVPRAGAAPSAGPTGAPATGGAKLSLSSATVEQLDELDGIGPTLAKRIVEYREQHGGFRSVAELDEVEGIGEKRMEALREAVGP